MLSVEMKKLKDSLSCCSYNGSQHSNILIKEDDRSAKDKLEVVKLEAPQGDWFAFSPEKGKKCKCNASFMSPLFSTEKNLHRACDHVIVVRNDNQLVVVYVELKSGEKPRGYENQFKSTHQFMHYLLGLLKEFHGIEFDLSERYVLFHGGFSVSLNKKTTTQKNKRVCESTLPDNPYKRLVYKNGKIYLNEFVGF